MPLKGSSTATRQTVREAPLIDEKGSSRRRNIAIATRPSRSPLYNIMQMIPCHCASFLLSFSSIFLPLCLFLVNRSVRFDACLRFRHCTRVCLSVCSRLPKPKASNPGSWIVVLWILGLGSRFSSPGPATWHMPGHALVVVLGPTSFGQRVGNM